VLFLEQLKLPLGGLAGLTKHVTAASGDASQQQQQQ
jgi:hypothetical protein